MPTKTKAKAKVKNAIKLSRVHTIWHYAMVFGYNQAELEQVEHDEESEVYCGHILRMPDQIATGVAELHPNYQQYYLDALMPLWRGYRDGFQRGTEDPQQAIASKRTSSEAELEFVLIWRAIP
jgi:hypothetical protein